MIHHLQFIELELTVISERDLQLPSLPASILRSGIGMTLKQLLCHQPESVSCRDCLAFSTCGFPILYEQMNDFKEHGVYAAYVRPFVMETEMVNKTLWNREEPFHFRIRLFGRHISLAHYFILSVIELGKKGLGADRTPFKLTAVTSKDSTGLHSSIYDCDRGFVGMAPVRTADEWFLSSGKKVSSINLNFQTPCRMKINWSLQEKLPFSLFIQNIMRRLQAISYHHHGILLDEEELQEICEEAKLIEVSSSNLHWQKMQRYSGRQKQEVPLDGFIGQVDFKGDITPFLPYIRAGSLLHIGKQTAFGLGWYKATVRY